MKKLALLLIVSLIASVVVVNLGSDRSLASENPVPSPSDCAGSDGRNKKREATSNGVQVKLEICGSDLDNYEIDAANPGSTKHDCTCKFTLEGQDKEEKPVQVSRSRTITVSST